MWFSKSFSTRLSLNVLLIVTIFFIVVLGIVAVSSHLLISEEATRSASNILKANILDIEKTLQTVESTVKDASWLVKENSKDEKYLYHITSKVVDENTNIIGSAIACKGFDDIGLTASGRAYEEICIQTRDLEKIKQCLTV